MHGSMRFWQCSSRNAMSASGHEQTSRHVRVMSVIPLKADIHQRGLHVRLVPLTDIPAIDGIDRSDYPPKVKFWAQAWKAAHQKAHAIGWLRS
jgi:hypothetical protein